MKNKILTSFAGVITSVALLLLTNQAYAVPVLTFTPNTQTVALGNQATVTIGVSGLSNEFVGAYDFSVNWDSSILSLSSVDFGNFLDGPNSSTTSVIASTGSVNVAEVSLGLLVNQDGFSDIELFTLTYDTLGLGDSFLDFTAGIEPNFGFLGDELGQELAVNTSQSLITVMETTSVSEPGLIWLMSLGLTGLLGFRRMETIWR